MFNSVLFLQVSFRPFAEKLTPVWDLNILYAMGVVNLNMQIKLVTIRRHVLVGNTPTSRQITCYWLVNP